MKQDKEKTTNMYTSSRQQHNDVELSRVRERQVSGDFGIDVVGAEDVMRNRREHATTDIEDDDVTDEDDAYPMEAPTINQKCCNLIEIDKGIRVIAFFQIFNVISQLVDLLMFVITVLGFYDVYVDGKQEPLRLGMISVSSSYSWVRYGDKIDTRSQQGFRYPTFRDHGHILMPIGLLVLNFAHLNSMHKYSKWIHNDTKETRLGLAQGHVLLIISSLGSFVIYLVASIVIFDDFSVFIGDWLGQILAAYINYYFVTVCLRFGEMKAVQDRRLSDDSQESSRSAEECENLNTSQINNEQKRPKLSADSIRSLRASNN